MSFRELLAYMNLRDYASGMLLCHQINRIWFRTLMEPSWHAKVLIEGNSAIEWASRPWQKKQNTSGPDTGVLVRAPRRLASFERDKAERISRFTCSCDRCPLMQIRCRLAPHIRTSAQGLRGAASFPYSAFIRHELLIQYLYYQLAQVYCTERAGF